MRSNQPDELDKLLDETLASYSSEEPAPGLEQRVLNRVRAASAPRRFGWWRWAVAIPVFASLLLLAVSHRMRPHPDAVDRNFALTQPPAPRVVAPAEFPPASCGTGVFACPPILDRLNACPTSQGAPCGRVRRVVHRQPVARSPLPRRAVFPLPAPLSPEERALVDLVTRFPDQAREVLIEAAQRSSQPIEIQRIEIPPLPGGTEQ